MQNVTLSELKRLREGMGWTQEMLKDASTISIRTIQRIESGGHTSVETAKSLAGALNLTSYAQLQAETLASTVPDAVVTHSTPNQEMECRHSPTKKRRTLPWSTMTLLLFIPGVLAGLGSLLYSDGDVFTPRMTGWFLVGLLSMVSTMFSMVRLAKATGAWSVVADAVRAMYGRAPGPTPAPEPMGKAMLYSGMAITHGLAMCLIIMPSITGSIVAPQSLVKNDDADAVVCTTPKNSNTQHVSAEFENEDVPVGLSQSVEVCSPSIVATTR